MSNYIGHQGSTIGGTTTGYSQVIGGESRRLSAGGHVGAGLMNRTSYGSTTYGNATIGGTTTYGGTTSYGNAGYTTTSGATGYTTSGATGYTTTGTSYVQQPGTQTYTSGARYY
jgi:hypothetical protein